MMIMIIIFIMIVLGIIGFILNIKYYEIGIIGVIALCSCLIWGIIMKLTMDIDYKHTMEERQLLEYRIEMRRNKNVEEDESLEWDIIKFNMNIGCSKRYCNNSLGKWFINYKLADIDYIGMDFGE